MNELFDTTPFAYVGNNKHYKDLTDEEKEELKNSSKRVEKEELPSSEEVEESSASVVGQMLPQVELTENEEPSLDDLMADVDEESELLNESLNDEVNGADIYFENASLIEKLKSKLRKNKDPENKIDNEKVTKAARAYTAMKMSASRLKLAVTKNPDIKGTSEFKELQKKVIITEKEFRKLKKNLNNDELAYINEFCSGFDSTFDKTIERHINAILEAQKSAIKTESVMTQVVTEKSIDSDMKPIIEKLNKKGYKTQSSSSGNNKLVAKDDSTENGVRDGRLYSDARLVFDGKYNLGKAPEYWYWKKVDNADDVEYLDIEEIKYDTTPGGPSKAFQDWKIKYMNSLKDWVDSLPDISDGKKEDKEEVEEACHESVEDIETEINTLYESVMNDLEFDIINIWYSKTVMRM